MNLVLRRVDKLDKFSNLALGTTCLLPGDEQSLRFLDEEITIVRNLELNVIFKRP